MPNREERRAERQSNRQARRAQRQMVRQEFAKNAALWIARYREALADAIREGDTELEAREEALQEALESFVDYLVHLLSRAATSSMEGRVRIIHNQRIRSAIITAISSTFRRLIKNAIQNVEIARSAAGLLTDKSAGEGGGLMEAFADLLDGGPEVIETPKRDPIIERRSPGDLPHRPLMGGIPVMADPVMADRAPVSEEEIIEVPG